MTTEVTVTVSGNKRAEIKPDGQPTIKVASGETKTITLEDNSHVKVEEKNV